MDDGSFMHACQLLLMRACVRRAYCKKCRVHIVLESVGRSNVPALIWRAVRCIKSAVMLVEQTWKSKRSMGLGVPYCALKMACCAVF